MNNNAIGERRDQDVRKIEDLAEASGGKIRLVSAAGNPTNKIEVELFYKTAQNNRYPTAVGEKTRLVIELPSRYPFQEPSAVIKTKIYHPNVYASGKICFGTKWIPTEGLDLLLKRVIQIITFDTTILNEASPANTGAFDLYRKAQKKTPNMFPTEKVSFATPKEKKKISWNNISADKPKFSDSEKTIVQCPSCKKSLRVPAGKRGSVVCPTCSHRFEAKS